MGETAEPRILLSGLAIGESPRWQGGRLWFSNWGTQEIIAVDIEGNSEVKVRVPTTIPFSIDWLPDGRMIVVSGPEARLLRHEPDGRTLFVLTATWTGMENIDDSARTGQLLVAEAPAPRAGRP